MRADAARWQQAQLEAANPQPAPQGNATTPIAGDGGVAE
jgi:hypothetical protein